MITLRQQRILKIVDVDVQSGMEIGPLAFPIVVPDMGDIVYADHATTDDLRAKKVWSVGNTGEGFELTENKKRAYDLSRQSVESGDYVDSHCWVLTPYTFIECYKDLVELGL